MYRRVVSGRVEKRAAREHATRVLTRSSRVARPRGRTVGGSAANLTPNNWFDIYKFQPGRGAGK